MKRTVLSCQIPLKGSQHQAHSNYFKVIAQYIPPCYNRAWGVKMNLVELVKVTSSEEEAEKFLRAKGILKTFDRCPFCGHQKIGRIRRSFFKCYGCRKEWSIRKDSILEGLKISFTKFILAVKLFILEVPVNKAYKELNLAYNTTHKIYNRIRQCIFKFVSEDDEFLSGEVEGVRLKLCLTQTKI
jgi:transposase